MARPTLSYRRILRQQLRIFNMTGKTMVLWMRNAEPNPVSYTPGQLYTSNTDPTENSSNYTRLNIKGKFEETDVVTLGDRGRQRSVIGVITVPMLFREQLAMAEYIDPYNDGSRFTKNGAIVDEGRIFVTLTIKSLSLTSVSEVV